jgi:hypothetical protein
MLTEEAHHLFVGDTGLERIIRRSAELTLQDSNGDARALGGIDLPTIQRFINYWLSYCLDLFGSEISTNAADYFGHSLKGRFNEAKRYTEHTALGQFRVMDVPGYELKLNSYDLGVDIELADAVQRLRFEHPEVRRRRRQRQGPRLLRRRQHLDARAEHARLQSELLQVHQRDAPVLEDAASTPARSYLCRAQRHGLRRRLRTGAGLRRDHLVDDRNSAVSLPEVPLLGVLPGTGGLTRVVDKRKVRRDLADHFCTLAEGVRGKRAVDWRLVDAELQAQPVPREGGEHARALADKP